MWARSLAALTLGLLLACSGLSGAPPPEDRSVESDLPYELVRSFTHKGPHGVPTVSASRLGVERIEIRLRSFPWYCAPTPIFDVVDDGRTLRLVARSPASPVARCTGNHDLTLRLASTATEVEVVRSGEVVAQGPVR